MPDLIKAFAIRLAHLDPSDTNRRIMRFVYRHHRSIASQLRQSLRADSEDHEVSSRDRQGGMSVMEKMGMWASKPQDLEIAPVDDSECFQAIIEEDDPELPTYGRAILQSKAYEWLIQHLLKQSSFSWGHGPRIVDEIRSAILNGLPARRISQNRNPDIYRAEFRMPLPQLRQRLLRESQRAGTAWDWKDVSAAVVLVSSSEDDDCILATRVEEYIDQIWGKDGELLTKFCAALGRELSGTDAGKRDNHPVTLSSYSREQSRHGGVSYSIAEQGEQLAWLLAALQGYGKQEAIFSKPSIHKRDADTWAIRAESVVHNGGLVTEPIIAYGFPTIRRPSASFCRGLEISPSVLFSLIPAESLVASDGQVRLFGADRVLELVDETQGVCLWHAVSIEGRGCECRRSSKLQISGEIHQYRHIVDTCPDSNGLESKLSTTLPHATEANPQKPETPAGPFAVAASDYQDSSSDCPETSLDSEMMSIPNSPEAPVYEIPSQLSPAIDVAAHRLLQQFHALSATWVANPWSSQRPSSDGATGLGAAPVNTRPQHETGRSCGGAGPHSPTAARNEASGRIPPRGRRRANCDEDEAEGGDGRQGNMPPPKKSRDGQDLPLNKALACPFWKFDPDRHRKCGKLDNFFQVNRVKQHLTRNHAEPKFYCDRCKTIFDGEPAYQYHLREAECMFKDWSSGDRFITRSQREKLHEKSKAIPEPDRWFAVWHIIFPGHSPPRSPYIDIRLSDDLRRFREYATGPRVEVALRAAGLREPDSL
ncbi:hypothetical protein C8A01DRAFT_17395, partial [Parachaetomium inaequale]